MKKLLTVGQAAELLAVSPNTVYRLTASGTIRAARIGGQIRISEDDLERYVRSCAIPMPRQQTHARRGRPRKEQAAKVVYYPGMKVV